MIDFIDVGAFPCVTTILLRPPGSTGFAPSLQCEAGCPPKPWRRRTAALQYVYLIESWGSPERRYVGTTNHLKRRLRDHNVSRGAYLNGTWRHRGPGSLEGYGVTRAVSIRGAPSEISTGFLSRSFGPSARQVIRIAVKVGTGASRRSSFGHLVDGVGFRARRGLAQMPVRIRIAPTGMVADSTHWLNALRPRITPAPMNCTVIS